MSPKFNPKLPIFPKQKQRSNGQEHQGWHKKELHFQVQLSSKEQIQDFEWDPLEVQQYVPSPQKNEGMLPLRPTSATCMNVFGEISTAHRSLGSLGTSSKGQTPRFHTLGSVQRIEVRLDEHRKVATMF